VVCTQALPVIGIGLLGGWVSIAGSCGLLLCCMAFSASDVYHLTADKLRQVCSDQGLDSGGPVRSLRQRLADHIEQHDADGDEDVTQASVPTDLVHNVMEPVPHKFGDSSHGGGGDSQPQVLVLLCQVSPLSSEEPEAILRLFVRLEEVHDLGLVDDRVFVTRILPLVSGSLLTFLGIAFVRM